jgi:CRP/FNR family cyclic AMP-dependent transcriptional regulator
METSSLGRTYRDGESIVRQGEIGDCMYVIQSGQAEVLRHEGDKDYRLAILGEGDVFGDMALFDRETRSATVRAVGEVRALTVDKKTFLRHVHEDPSLAFRILEKMSRRIRDLDAELVRLRAFR